MGLGLVAPCVARIAGILRGKIFDTQAVRSCSTTLLEQHDITLGTIYQVILDEIILLK
jgi:hypothetical protein